jgi:hypothetical protein
MTMPPGLRTFILTLHIACAVGWIGAVVAYLVLVVAAMNSQGAQTVRAAWIALALIGWYAIVPLALAALLSGLVIALGTKWGLFQHYWVLVSLVLTIFATTILLLHMPSVSAVAGSVTETGSTDVGGLRAGLGGELFHAGVGLLVLLVIQGLNVYKPRGLTPYGWRKQQEARTGSPSASASTTLTLP